MENLCNSFPDTSKEELEQIARQYYKHLADLIIESIKMPALSKKEVLKRVKFKNFELIDQYYTDRKSLFAVLGHYGNWEWGGLALSAKMQHRLLAIYKPLNNKRWDRFFIQVRSRFGAIPVPMKDTLRNILQYKHVPTLTVFIGDQSPVKHEIQYWTNFMNQQTPVFLGIEKIALKIHYPIIFFDMRKVKRGYYEVDCVKLFEEPHLCKEHEITEKHVRYLEKMIREEPAYWLWSHRRWKHKPA